MWAVNGGSIYFIGYVPIEAIQQEGRLVNQNLFMVVIVMLAAFFLCCLLFYLNQREQDKLRREQEAERELHNKQLAEALQAARIASKSKTMFLSNMSHDIRTPMNAILGFTTLLAKDAEDPAKVREYTRKITSSGQHLLSLINDVLDVSKIESGKVVLILGEFTLKNLVSSVDAIIRPMARAKGQNFEVSVTNIKHEYLVGNETRMNQILINLLSNAVKYTPEGGNIWFRIIGLKQHSAQYEHIRIQVEDDGYGMTPEDLMECCRVFKENGIETPIGANRWWLECIVFAQAYADLYNRGNTEAEIEALNKGEAKYSDYMRPGLYLKELMKKGYIDAEAAYTYEAIEGEGPDFLAGKTPIVMAYWGAANTETAYGKTDFELQVIGLPSSRGPMPVVPITGYAVSAEGEHGKDAMDVLEIILSDEASNASMKVEQWGNTCLIVRQLLGGATVDECMAEFDRLQEESLEK